MIENGMTCGAAEHELLMTNCIVLFFITEILINIKHWLLQLNHGSHRTLHRERFCRDEKDLSDEL